MKTIKYISLRVLAIAALALVFAMPAKAQLSDNGYANIDWQFNVPLSNGFADDASGWGMNFEGGYFITPNLGLGLFLNYHSNHEYVGRETFPVNGGSMTSDQQHTIFQMPFGAADKMVALFMLLKSGEIKDKNIATPKKSGKAVSKIAKPQAPSKSKEDSEPSDPVVKPQPHGNRPNLHIDLQIHISPESTPEQIEAIFASMAKHLYGAGN